MAKTITVKTVKQLFDDLRYHVDIEYNTDTSHCTCQDICRCGRVVDIKVKGFYGDISELFFGLCKDEIEKYCVDRIVTHGVDINNIQVSTTWGYYGEELGTVKLNNSPVAELESALSTKSPLKKIFQTLTYEYGYLLPDLEKMTKVEVIEIPSDLINIGNTEHYRRLDKQAIERYKNNKNKLPKAVVCAVGEGYRLIDGYHRIAAQGKGKIKVIVLS